MVIIFEILLFIDGIIYDFVTYIYDIFDFLARINLFGEDQYNDIVGRIYIVLGVLMLFVLAYTLLRAIINPEEFSKGETSFANLAKNIVVSLIIIVLLPTIFRVAFNIQNAILNTNTIEHLILGNTSTSYSETYNDITIDMSAGRMIAVDTFSAFFYPNPESTTCQNDGTRDSLEKCKDNIHSEVLFFFNGTKTLRQIDAYVKDGKSMTNYAKFGKAVHNGQIRYSPLISTACGIFLLYVLLNFVFDMAVRIIKLMFYQIIAPIPVVCRIIPFGGFKDVFKNWLKQVTSVFFEVFVRIAIMNFGVLLIKLNIEAFNSGYKNGILTLGGAAYNIGWLQFLLARVLIDMGIIMFIRKAPELISKMFGIDTGGLKLGIRERIAQGGGYIAAGAIGAAGGMAIRNGARGFNNTREAIGNARNAQPGAERRRAIGRAIGTGVRGLGSTVAGAASGGLRSGYRARTAQNGQDMRNATRGAVETATRNRDTRTEYRNLHQDTNQQHSVVRRWVHNNITGAPLGHLSDARDDIVHWVNEGSEPHQAERRVYEQLNRYRGSVETNSNEILERSRDNTVLANDVINAQRESYMRAHIEEYDQTNAVARQRAADELRAIDANHFDNVLDDAGRNAEINAYLAQERARVVSQFNRRFGDANNLDLIRGRVERLRNTTFSAGMEVDGIVFNSLSEWDDYVATATHALDDFERDANNLIRASVMNSHDFITEHGTVDREGIAHINIAQVNQARTELASLQSMTYTDNMTHNGRTFRTQNEWNAYVARERENLENFERMINLGWMRQDGQDYVYSGSSGIQDRVADINSYTNSIQETFRENSNLIRINLDPLLPDGQSLENMDSFERMDQFGHLTRRRNALINQEREERERRAAARGGNNGGNNNGGGHGGHH